MKIQSHEIAMQSQHRYERIELQSALSFSTVFIPEPQGSEEEIKIDEVTPNESGMFRSLNDIISSLINMISAKRDRNIVQRQFSFAQTYEEHESLSFSTIGHIQTDTGTIDLNLNFSMSRDFAIENRIDIFSSFDPLVINLDGAIPDLSTDTFSFDLDNDGVSEQISTLASGSGFLAYDKNNDGIINQGSELFGTITGNGFGELSEYDEDNNHWIDENDAIFDKLQIWLKNEDTNEKELVGLGEVGIGAIFLDSQTSEFTYKTAMNKTLGEMKSCGIFLSEDGSVGTIAQVDLASQSNQEIKPLEKLLQA